MDAVMDIDMRHTVKRRGAVFLLSAILATSGATRAGAEGSDEASARQPRIIEVTASRFAFEPADIEVAVGESVRLLVHSIDVEHGFAIPSLGIGETIPPDGPPVAIDLVAGQVGRHRIVCSVFCGAGHGRMRGTLSIVAAAGAAPASGGPDRVDDLELDPLETDFNLITLPTTLRLPQGKFAFRLTHRFSRPLDGREGDGGLVRNFFGFDSPALIGIEFRYGLLPGTKVGINRSNTRHIQLFARHNILWQRGPRGIGLDIQASLEGLDNLSEDQGGSVQAIFSKRFANRVSLYVQPTFVTNVNTALFFHPDLDDDLVDDDDDGGGNEDKTFMVGLGARFRMRPTVYLVGEFVPRVSGFDSGSNHMSFGIEKVVGGHTFQVNVSNSLGTTPLHHAQGASDDNGFIGFNIGRKFY
jgi:cytochrome c oxidase subunit 2